MMERLVALLLGILIGYCLGRYSRRVDRKLDAIKEELHEVDEIVKDQSKTRDDSGFMQIRIVRDAAVLVTVLLAAYAAFITQGAANEAEQNTKDLRVSQIQLKEAQHKIERIVECNQIVLNDTVDALNERTTYSGGQANANVDLVKSQVEALRVIIGPPPPTPEASDKATRDYVNSAARFLGISAAQAQKVLENSYPAKDALNNCIDEAQEVSHE